jgi:pyruvate,water dikinase
VQTLDRVRATDIARVGGKGANLGELVAAGVPVPAAFCVTTDAYRSFLDTGGLSEGMAALLDRIDYDDPAGIEHSASAIRALFLGEPTPPVIAEEITTAYRGLESSLGFDVSVSVRSSATAEDLPGMSFAGQQDTFLFVSGAERVVDAVKRCWASLWTDRAIAYRHTQGFDHERVWLAVVVQEMFPSEVSGILFTANPVTSNPDEHFLNLSWGLGEAVVSGRVNPDQLVVAKGSAVIVERKVADKELMTIRHPCGHGSVEAPVPDELREIQALADEQVLALCTIGQRIEDHCGFPQDIEWGWAGGRFAILQAREITGANLDYSLGLELWKAPAALASMYDERWVWSRAYSDEVQTGPSTPSFYTYLQLGMTRLKAAALTMTGTSTFLEYAPESFTDFPFFRWYGARAYYNLAFERERIRRFIPPFARDEATLWPFPAEEREEIRSMPFDWHEFLGLLGHLHATAPDVSLLGTTAVVYEGLERWTDDEEAFWRRFDLEQATVEEIFAAQLASREGSRFGENVVLPFTIYLFMLPQALRMLCALWLDDSDGQICNRLMGGLQTKTSEENIAVWRLSRAVKATPRLAELVRSKPNVEILAELDLDNAGRAFGAELDVFIAAYGHRGGAERDAYHPRWRHDPARVFDVIRPMVTLGDEDSPERHEGRLRELMLETRAACAERLRGAPLDVGRVDELGWLVELHEMSGRSAADRADVFDWFVDVVQDYVCYRDFERFYNDKTMSRSRDLYEAIARRLMAHELLADPDHVFFLGRQEMLAADVGELTARQIELRVRSRRRVYDRYSHHEPPKYLRGWQAFDDDQVDGDGALRGIGASTGRVTGRARVCRSLSEISRLERGDILVTVATDPGWTTVFSIIGGVVVETGGVVAHAVMISREYGLPCVANLTRACDLIPDGSIVTVDGTAGRVLVHEGESADRQD